MQAVILAGGLGTRLRSMVSEVPKSLASVGGRPFVEHLLIQLRGNGFERVVICAGHMSDQLSAHLADGSGFGLEISLSIEDEPLGTGGALRHAEPYLLGSRWLVMNGDSYFEISLGALVERHIEHEAPVTLALSRSDDARRYGAVELAADGLVTSFIEKGAAEGPALINAGLYVVERAALELIPAGQPASFERDVLPQLIGHGLRGEVFDGFFIDIGIPEDYERAQGSTAFAQP